MNSKNNQNNFQGISTRTLLKPISRYFQIKRKFSMHLVALLQGKKVSTGKDFRLGGGNKFAGCGNLLFEDNVGIGTNCHFQTNLKIGRNTLISSNVGFIGNDHEFDLRRDEWLPLKEKVDITIGKNCLIGYGAILIGNIEISSNVTIGAGTVVTKSIYSRGTYVGVPARKISD